MDAEIYIIVAADFSNQASDCPQLKEQIEQVLENTVRHPKEVSAHAGYYSEDNTTFLKEQGIDPYVPPEKVKHSEGRAQGPPRGRIPKCNLQGSSKPGPRKGENAIGSGRRLEPDSAWAYASLSSEVRTRHAPYGGCMCGLQHNRDIQVNNTPAEALKKGYTLCLFQQHSQDNPSPDKTASWCLAVSAKNTQAAGRHNA